MVNPAFWPGYPYAELAADYDALLPMAYWTLRTGDLRSSVRYIGENVDRLRALVGDDEPIHVIGGIADEATAADVEGMLAALRERDVIGGSLYDWATSNPAQWEILRPAPGPPADARRLISPGRFSPGRRRGPSTRGCRSRSARAGAPGRSVPP